MQFSKPMGDSAIALGQYVIVQTNYVDARLAGASVSDADVA